MGTGTTSKEPESINFSLDDISKILDNMMQKFNDFDNKLKNFPSKSDIEEIIDDKLKNFSSIIDNKFESLKREIENIKYKTNMNVALQAPPTYMNALSGVAITGGTRSINSHYLD